MLTEKISGDKLTKTAQEKYEYFLNQAFTPFAILEGRNLVFIFSNPLHNKADK